MNGVFHFSDFILQNAEGMTVRQFYFLPQWRQEQYIIICGPLLQKLKKSNIVLFCYLYCRLEILFAFVEKIFIRDIEELYEQRPL